MPVPVARPVNLLHDFATRLYDYLGATTRTTRIVAGLSVWRGTRRVRLLSSPVRSSQDSNTFRKNVTDGAGR